MRTILVALDGSPFAEAAIPVALGLARTLDAQVEFVTVHEPPPGVHTISGAMVHDLSFDRERSQLVRAALQDALGEAVARAKRVPDAPPISGVLLEGRPADLLLDHAATIGAHAIVLTTHGRGGLSRAWLGSVTDTILLRATIPVVSVRPTETNGTNTTDTVLAARRINRLLVTLDGTRSSWSAIEPLHALFGDRVEYVLFRAIAPLHPILQAIASDSAYQRDLEEQKTQTTSFLRAAVEQLERRSLRASICIRTEIVPANAICACGEANDIDMIAVGTKIRTVVARMMLGSVADKVARTSDRPVLCYKLPLADD